jgi:hypothetical protein
MARIIRNQDMRELKCHDVEIQAGCFRQGWEPSFYSGCLKCIPPGDIVLSTNQIQLELSSDFSTSPPIYNHLQSHHCRYFDYFSSLFAQSFQMVLEAVIYRVVNSFLKLQFKLQFSVQFCSLQFSLSTSLFRSVQFYPNVTTWFVTTDSIR